MQTEKFLKMYIYILLNYQSHTDFPCFFPSKKILFNPFNYFLPLKSFLLKQNGTS